jgi:hypothetical protein
LTLVAHTLGTRLKAERESRGFTLAQVSSSTKIPVTLLDALERDDLSRWPKGLYRRAFFRSYVTALGLRAEPLVFEFTREFPDDDGAAQAPGGFPADRLRAGSAPGSQVSPHAPQTELALSWAGPSPMHRVLRSAGMALAEVSGVVGAAALIAWLGGMQVLAAIGAVAVVYYPVVRVAAERRRTSFLRAGRPSAIYRGSEGAPVTRVSAEPAAAGAQSADLRAQVVERLRPVAAGLMTTTAVAAPVIGRSGHLVKVGLHATGRMLRRATHVTSTLLIHGGRTTGRELGQIAQITGRVSWRALGSANRVFWRGVRSAAEQAALLAGRQLNRTRE